MNGKQQESEPDVETSDETDESNATSARWKALAAPKTNKVAQLVATIMRQNGGNMPTPADLKRLIAEKEEELEAEHTALLAAEAIEADAKRAALEERIAETQKRSEARAKRQTTKWREFYDGFL